MVVYSDEGPRECQYLAKGDKHAMVYLTQWWAAEARDEQHTAKYAQTDR